MILKKCCRTCRYLSPDTYEDGDYDWEENYISEKYPCNCEFVWDNFNIDVINVCEHYEPIDIKDLIVKPDYECVL